MWKRMLALISVGVLCAGNAAYAAEGEPVAETPVDTGTAGEVTPEPEPTPEPLPESYYWAARTDSIEGWPAGPQVEAEAAVVMDTDYGTILYAKNPNKKRYPASITKIMTTLVALENSKADEVVTFSENAVWGIERDSSNIGIDVGEQLTMEQCYYAMMLASANEVCMAVAEHIAGSTEDYVELMNKKAQQLGCKNTHFNNTNGLPDKEHYTTAYDMALIAKAAYSNPLFKNIAKTVEYKIPPTNKWEEERYLLNHHKMLYDSGVRYEGCLGGKTGYTQKALNTLVTYAHRNGSTLICVNLRTDGTPVYTDTAAMLDYGFNNFTWKKVYNMNPTSGEVRLLPSQSNILKSKVNFCATKKGYGWVLVPSDVEVKDLTMKKAMERNAAGPWREVTTYYYNNWRVGRSYKYELPVLRELFLPSL